MKNSGLSMVEIIVAVVIIALATGPLIGVLSSSNKMSNASIFEEMAVHYARELSDQLLRLGNNFSAIVNDARSLTGDSSINLASILNDPGFSARLGEHADGPKAVPLQIAGNELPVRIILSPLDKAFIKRKISVVGMDTSSNSVLNTNKFWKVKIELAWIDKNSGRNDPREMVMDIFLKEG
ncbi:MAG: hypothetical protein Kow0029_31280 [Candidatus Rifleibacteriota bacterium]